MYVAQARELACWLCERGVPVPRVHVVRACACLFVCVECAVRVCGRCVCGFAGCAEVLCVRVRLVLGLCVNVRVRVCVCTSVCVCVLSCCCCKESGWLEIAPAKSGNLSGLQSRVGQNQISQELTKQKLAAILLSNNN